VVWKRANETQEALAAAEAHFLSVCETEEIDPAAIEEAEDAMQRAAAEADEALNEIRVCSSSWAATFARMLR
jgi:hypothetical protein